MRNLSVYVHFPFCLRKCRYCDFLSRAGAEEEWDFYIKKLCEEIRNEALHYRQYEVVTVFLGGGTPSLLSGKQMEKIMSCLHTYYKIHGDAEITVEMNPGTVTAEKLAAYREMGVNRLSLGLQSADNEQLSLLGRIHTWETFLESYELCRGAGFSNLNVDIMSALPGQTYASYKRTLEKVSALQPEHISAYSLIIEKGTPFYEIYDSGQESVSKKMADSIAGTAENWKELPDEETDRAMYEETKRFLAERGYTRYEISNYARKEKACVHNCVYWTRENYVGFGLGASSMVENVRWSNVRTFSDYYSLPAGEKKENVHTLSVEEQMEEMMYLGLRMMEGVSGEKFAKTFGCSMEKIYGEVIQRHRALGLLEKNGDRLRLTDRGIDVSNYVMADFLLA